MSDDEIRIPWGRPGPTDPSERPYASRLDLDGDEYSLTKPIEWSSDGVIDPGQPEGDD